MAINRFSVVVFVWATVLSLVWFPHRGVSDDGSMSATVYERFSFESDEHIAIPVLCFGEQQLFFVDTGCMTGVLDEQFRDRLVPAAGRDMVKIPASTLSNRRIEQFIAPEMRIGKPGVPYFPSGGIVICTSLQKPFRAATGRDYKGIIGMDFLKSKVLRINLDEGYAEFKGVSEVADLRGEPIHFNGNIPSILLRLSNEGFKSFRIDTGSSANVVLESKLFDKLCQRRKIALDRRVHRAGLGGMTHVRTGFLDWAELGEHRFTNVRVIEGITNSLGYRFLANFDVELDFPGKVAYFRPGQRIDQPCRYDRAGFGVANLNGKIVVKDLDPVGVAAKASLQEEDEIITINGVVADELPLVKIHYLLTEPGAELSMTVRRGGITKSVSFQLSNEPDPFPVQSAEDRTPRVPDFDSDDQKP
jgi:hypothetical protein